MDSGWCLVCRVPGPPTHLTSMSVGKPALELIIEWPAYHCCAFASGPALMDSSLLPQDPDHDGDHFYDDDDQDDDDYDDQDHDDHHPHNNHHHHDFSPLSEERTGSLAFPPCCNLKTPLSSAFCFP